MVTVLVKWEWDLSWETQSLGVCRTRRDCDTPLSSLALFSEDVLFN